MIRKLFLALMILSLCATAFGADTVTTNYRFIIPEEGSRDWNQKISNDIITIDSALKILSDDSTIVSTDVGLISNTVVIISNDIMNLLSADGVMHRLTIDAVANTDCLRIISSDNSRMFYISEVGGLSSDSIKSGSTQAAAGAFANEFWVDTDNQQVMYGS